MVGRISSAKIVSVDTACKEDRIGCLRFWCHCNNLLFTACRWMASNDTCPICRASLTQRPLPPATASCLPQRQAGAARVGVQQTADHHIQEELLFRLSSVQRLSI